MIGENYIGTYNQKKAKEKKSQERKTMKPFKKLITIMLTVCLACTMFAPVTEAATAKKSIYVVTGIKIEYLDSANIVQDKNTGKITYDDNGFISKTSINGDTQKLSYDSKYQLKKYVFTRDKTEKTIYKYTWKNGLATKCAASYEGMGDCNPRTITLKYNYKKQLTSAIDAGGSGSKYAYKNGNMVKRTNNLFGGVDKYSYDDKGNITKSSDSVITLKRKITYSGNRIKSYVTDYGPDYWKQKRTFTYKKITVNKAYANAVKEQQWKLINNLSLGVDAFDGRIGIGF